MHLHIHRTALAQLNGKGVGTVIHHQHVGEEFLALVSKTIIDIPDWRAKFPDGLGVLSLSDVAKEYVLSGVIATEDVTGEVRMVARLHRGEWIAVADRESVPLSALEADNVEVVVYDRAAFLSDPQVVEAEWAHLEFDFMLVTILASRGPKPPLTSRRFVRNLGGGNNNMKPPVWPDGEVNGIISALMLAQEREDYIVSLRAQARAVAEYEEKWVLVG